MLPNGHRGPCPRQPRAVSPRLLKLRQAEDGLPAPWTPQGPSSALASVSFSGASRKFLGHPGQRRRRGQFAQHAFYGLQESAWPSWSRRLFSTHRRGTWPAPAGGFEPGTVGQQFHPRGRTTSAKGFMPRSWQRMQPRAVGPRSYRRRSRPRRSPSAPNRRGLPLPSAT